MNNLAEIFEHELSLAITNKDTEAIKRFSEILAGKVKPEEKVGEKLQILSTDIRILTETMREGFKSIDKRFEAVDKRFEDLIHYMDKRFESVDKRFEDMNKRFNQLTWIFSMWFTLLTAITIIAKFISF